MEKIRNESDKTLDNGSTSRAVKSFQCQVCQNKYFGVKPDCPICNKNFNSSSHVKKHSRIRTGKKLHRCAACNESFNTLSGLNEHNIKHRNEKPYQCQICSKEFIYLKSLNKHKILHTVENPYECEICFEEFVDLKKLNNHKRKHIDGNVYKCEICIKGFVDTQSLHDHIGIHNKCGKNIYYSNGSMDSEQNPFACDICGEKFKDKEYLELHKSKHTEENPFFCEICNKTFRYLFMLKAHKRVHSQRFECTICNRLFINSNRLTAHQRIHDIEKLYNCNIRSESFDSIDKLKKHKNTIGKTSFKCFICNKTFWHLRFLMEHISKIHKIENNQQLLKGQSKPKSQIKTGLESFEVVETGEMFQVKIEDISKDENDSLLDEPQFEVSGDNNNKVKSFHKPTEWLIETKMEPEEFEENSLVDEIQFEASEDFQKPTEWQIEIKTEPEEFDDNNC